MTPEQIFSLANPAATLGWVLLLAAPRRRWATFVAGRVIPLGLAAAYLVLFVVHWFEGKGGFSTLQGVADLFSNPWLLLAGWIHYLAFDLLIGAWEVRDAQRRGIPHLFVVPCLALTFMLGPAGWLLYRAVRRFASTAA